MLLSSDSSVYNFSPESMSKWDLVNSYLKLRKVRFATKVAVTMALCMLLFLVFTPLTSDSIDVYSPDYVTPKELYPDPAPTPAVITELGNEGISSDEGVVNEVVPDIEEDVNSGHGSTSVVHETDPDHLGEPAAPVKDKIVTTIFTDSRSGYKKIIFRNTAIENSGDAPTVLVMSSIGNEYAFGPERTFGDFIETIKTYEYDRSLLSLGFLCGSEAVWDAAQMYLEDLKSRDDSFDFARVTLVRETFIKESFGRHDDRNEVQRIRRRLIARWRNFALLSALVDERYTLFMDADVFRIDNPDMLERFIRLEHDVAVPIVGRPGSTNDYDRNSWVGPRTRPTEDQMELFNEGKWEEAAYVPNDADQMRHLSNMVEDIENLPEDSPMRDLDYSEEVDSVGGAILFFKSLLFKQGAIFPPLYIIGADWDREEGYDGIETEGLCYIAKTMNYKCWAMPNLVGQHVA